MIKNKELTDPNSCMNRAGDEEMTFVLLQRDKAAPTVIRVWAAERIKLGKNKPEDSQILEALACAATMEANPYAGVKKERTFGLRGIEEERNIRFAGLALTAACHGASLKAGWWKNLMTGEPTITEPHIVGEKLMLVVSEVAEAMEGHRKNLNDDKLPHRSMVEVELADAVIRIFDLAGALNLDLGSAIAEKMSYNAIRPDHKLENRQGEHGKKY